MQLPDLPIPDIIEAAAKSTLGVFALMIVALALLGYAFFSKANQNIRLAVFVMLFAGVVAFGIALMRAEKKVREEREASSKAPTSTEDRATVSSSAPPLSAPSKKATPNVSNRSDVVVPARRAIVLEKLTMHETPQSGTWLLCFRAIAGADTQQFHQRDQKYSGDNKEIPIDLRLASLPAGGSVELEAFLDDDESDVCTARAEDRMLSTFIPESSGSKTFQRDQDWSYTLSWRHE